MPLSSSAETAQVFPPVLVLVLFSARRKSTPIFALLFQFERFAPRLQLFAWFSLDGLLRLVCCCCCLTACLCHSMCRYLMASDTSVTRLDEVFLYAKTMSSAIKISPALCGFTQDFQPKIGRRSTKQKTLLDQSGSCQSIRRVLCSTCALLFASIRLTNNASNGDAWLFDLLFFCLTSIFVKTFHTSSSLIHSQVKRQTPLKCCHFSHKNNACKQNNQIYFLTVVHIGCFYLECHPRTNYLNGNLPGTDYFVGIERPQI